MPAKVIVEKCTGCGECVEQCPEESIKLVDELAVVDTETCTDCGICVDACTEEAIEIE